MKLLKVVALGIELSATRLSAVFGQPALDYHKSGASGSNRNPPLPKQACSICHLRPSCQSERSDPEPISGSQNRRDNQTSLRSSVCQYPVRESNPHLQIESLQSLPIDQRGMLCFVVCAPVAQSGPGGARILVCGASNRRYTISATSPNSIGIGLSDRQEPKKKARRL